MNVMRVPGSRLAAIAVLLACLPAAARQESRDLLAAPADVRFLGRPEAGKFGHSLASGDVNGDGVADLIVGSPLSAPGGRGGAGRVMVFLGSRDLPAFVEIDALEPDLVFLGESAGDGLGSGVAAGDFNGDGVDDLLMGAQFADQQYRGDSGEAYIVYGSRSFPRGLVWDLAVTRADVTFWGKVQGDRMGQAVAAGDMNGDGLADAVLGAPWTRGYTGDAYVIFGRANWPPRHLHDLLATPADVTLLGPGGWQQLGWWAQVADVGGDATPDLIVSCPMAHAHGNTNSGETYVVLGRAGFPSGTVLDLSTTLADLTIQGILSYDRCGWSFAASDVDGDGVGDLLLGAFRADPPGGAQAGEAYLVRLRRDLPPNQVIDLRYWAPDLRFRGDNAEDFLAWAVTAADLDGDRRPDLVLAAIQHDPLGRTDAGRVYVFHAHRNRPWGTVVDLNTMPADLTIEGAQPGGNLGYSLLSADLNGDGIQDLVIGADLVRRGGIGVAGTVYVLLGGPLGLAARPPIGTTATLRLSAPWDAARDFLGAASLLTAPEIPLGGGRVLPLAPDPLFAASLLVPSLFPGFRGTLSPAGEAEPWFPVPAEPALAGVTIHAAFVTLDPAQPGVIRTITNRRAVTFAVP